MPLQVLGSHFHDPLLFLASLSSHGACRFCYTQACDISEKPFVPYGVYLVFRDQIIVSIAFLFIDNLFAFVSPCIRFSPAF